MNLFCLNSSVSRDETNFPSKVTNSFELRKQFFLSSLEKKPLRMEAVTIFWGSKYSLNVLFHHFFQLKFIK